MIAALLFLLCQAATETYDLASFQVPEGKRELGPAGLTFTERTAKSFWQVLLTKAVPGSGDPAKDFKQEWAAWVAKAYSVKEEPKSGSAELKDGWTLTLGAASVTREGTGEFVCILAVYSGHGVRTVVVVNLNDEVYRPKVQKFFDSIRLAKPAAAPAPADAEKPPPLRGRIWNRGGGLYSNRIGARSIDDVLQGGNQGYSNWKYQFKDDGSYEFVGETFATARNTEYWFHEESGAYTLEAGVLRLTPKSASRILRDKDGKAQGESAPIEKEAASYRVQFHYFSGLKSWNVNAQFPSSYLYGDPPPK
jgi:hypothetical protein